MAQAALKPSALGEGHWWVQKARRTAVVVVDEDCKLYIVVATGLTAPKAQHHRQRPGELAHLVQDQMVLTAVVPRVLLG